MTATSALPPLLKSLSLSGLAVAIATSAFVYVVSSDTTGTGTASDETSSAQAPRLTDSAPATKLAVAPTSTGPGNGGINPQHVYRMEWPNNGTLFAPNAQDMIRGYTEIPGARLHIEALDPDSLAPDIEDRWVYFGLDATASLIPDSSVPSLDKPAYAWAVTATPASPPAFWTNALAHGGVLRLRAKAVDLPGGLTVADPGFDIDSPACLQSQYALATQARISWIGAGNHCASPFPMPYMALGSASTGATALSATVVPNDLGRPFISMVSPTADFNDPEAQDTGTAYYAATGAAATLSDFKSRYGFKATEKAPYTNGEVESRYYNKGDLGIGRLMHCRKFILSGRSGLACYVRNYANTNDANDVVFGTDENSYLRAALQNTSGQNFATVAMVQYDDSPQVDFSVYGHQIIVIPRPAPRPPIIQIVEELSPIAKLDNHGSNVAVPTNCLSCHGGTYDETHSIASGARFLPFDSDPRMLTFATGSLATSFPAYTQAAQAGNIRELNRLILEFAQTPTDVKTHITTMYGHEDGVTLGPSYIPGYVPSTWSTTPASTKLYKEVVKPYCIGCHVSWPRPGGTNFFANYSDFVGAGGSVFYSVCNHFYGPNFDTNNRRMPAAEQTNTNFWKSPARAYLLNHLGNGTERCDP